MPVDHELAQGAKDLLADTVTMKAFEAMQAQLLAEFLISKPEDKQLREDIYFQLRALDSLKQTITAMAQDPAVQAFKTRRRDAAI